MLHLLSLHVFLCHFVLSVALFNKAFVAEAFTDGSEKQLSLALLPKRLCEERTGWRRCSAVNMSNCCGNYGFIFSR